MLMRPYNGFSNKHVTSQVAYLVNYKINSLKIFNEII